MIHGESRFFTNWQMPKEVSSILHDSKLADDQRNVILSDWLASTGIYERIQFRLDESEQNNLHSTILQFTQNNLTFCKKNTLSEEKMTVVMEIFHYLMRQLIDQGELLLEDQAYENFKSLLLRHAVHRPPHALAILTLDEVKIIDLYAQDSFFRHFDMYKFSLTVKDEMQLKQDIFFTHKDPQMAGLGDGKDIKYTEIVELGEYFSEEE